MLARVAAPALVSLLLWLPQAVAGQQTIPASAEGQIEFNAPSGDIGCIYTGTLADYAVEQGAAAVDMELTNHRDTDFDMNLKILKVFLSWE